MKKQLHHYSHVNSYQFVTFRTKDSIDDFLRQLQSSNLDETNKQFSMDQYLDQSPQGRLLNGDIIDLVKLFCRNLDPYFYHLYCVSVMPNHVHLLFKQQQDLGIIMQKLKGGLANLINKRLGLSGTLWQRDYFDKTIRDEHHFNVTYKYIKFNALGAGLSDAENRFYGLFEDSNDQSTINDQSN